MPSSAAILEIPLDVLESARLDVEELRVELAIHLYASGRLGLGKARELAGLSLWQFRQLLGNRKIPAHVSVHDLEHDLETLRQLDDR